MSSPLSRSFYLKDIHILATRLLGCLFVREFEEGKRISGKIVELEVYTQKGDPSSHSFNGKTKRNEVMFEQAGHLYVYFTYGIHYCCNIVCGPEGQGDAILIRALEPVQGIEDMMNNRYGLITHDNKKVLNLTNGPAKLCQALKIRKEENNIDLCGQNIWIEKGEEVPGSLIGCSTRIGINQEKDLPWRYFIKNNSCVSKPGKGIKYFDR
ncbi:MAG: DNA-3-methyladenine glycosylase [Candidatus Marinimicrobia bacterium]|nr:DNA-3-methyladenine glycosylase [Candidatus Neomarinimicrobiota bacterium]